MQDLFLYRKLLRFWLYRYNSRFGERFRDGQYNLVTFLLFVLILSVPPCPVICKSGDTCPVLYGVGATFVGQFHTKVHIIKQLFNLNAQCHRDYFSSACVESYARSDAIKLVL